jgi:hypothetical protein
MVAVSTIIAGAAIGGLAVSGYSAVQQAEARRDATEASRRAERLRERQMQLDAQRRQREVFRRQMIARATTVSRTTAQNAGLGSSAVGGAFGEQAGTTGRDTLYNALGLDIGRGLFDANADIAEAQGRTATYEGLGQLGTSFVNNAQLIGQVGHSLFGPSGNSSTTDTSVIPGGVGNTGSPY